jgi:hypothetical protein
MLVYTSAVPRRVKVILYATSVPTVKVRVIICSGVGIEKRIKSWVTMENTEAGKTSLQ